jgi:hypothetical protein
VVGIVGERVRRRNIRRANLGNGRRSSNRLARRRHHVGRINHGGILASSRSRSRSEVLGLVASAGIGIVVNARVTSQLIGAAEALSAARELAGMGLFAGMGPNVTCLMFQAVESPVAKRTFVGPGKILTDLLVGGTSTLHKRRQQADGRSHRRV